jgi:predicted transposase/invertase (TIGR01784 family)
MRRGGLCPPLSRKVLSFSGVLSGSAFLSTSLIPKLHPSICTASHTWPFLHGAAGIVAPFVRIWTRPPTPDIIGAMRTTSLINDIIFRYVFGTEGNQPLLICLLNAILGYSGKDRIRDIRILNPNIERECLDDKLVVLDIKATDCLGRLFNVEVQLTPKAGYIGRVMYYLAKLYSGQLEPGEPFTELSKTIGISILDFVLFTDTSELHNTYRLKNIMSHSELTDLLELHFIELVKFDVHKAHELRTPFEKWLHILKFSELYGDMLGPIPVELKEEEGIAMAIDAYRKANSDSYVRQLIELREKAEHDRATELEEAKAEGLVEGEARGEARGKAEALRRSLRLFVESRFGAFEGVLAEKIEKIEDADRLERLLKALFTASDISDIERIAG